MVTVPTTTTSLQATAPATPPTTGWLQLCVSVTGAPKSRPVLPTPVRVPVMVSLIKPEVPVVVFVGMRLFSVCAVNVNVKVPPPPVVEGTVRTKLDAPEVIDWVKGLMVTFEPSTIPKFPVDALLAPGLTRVFAVVAAEMFPAGVRVAAPPPPGVYVKVPLAGTAYAGLSAVDASSNAPNPVAPIKLVLTLLIFTPFQLAYHVTAGEAASTMPIDTSPTDGLCFNTLPDMPIAPSRLV